jgi:hypothetical protein
MKNIFLFSLVFLFQVVNAQGVLKSGAITFSISGLDMDDPKSKQMNNPEMMEMFKNMMKYTMYFNPDHQKMSIDVMNGMTKTQVYYDATKSKSTTYMDMMGKKYKMIGEEAAPATTEKPKVEVVYDKTNTKKILDFDCYKATMKISNIKQPENAKGKKAPSEMTLTCYITESISPSKLTMNNYGHNLAGFPLEFIMETQGMKMNVTATSIEKNVDVSVFEEPTGYKEVTKEEFEKEIGKSAFNK